MHLQLRLIPAAVFGAAAALLLARLLLRLLAARPSNPVFGWFLSATAPPPFLAATLDAGQPRFGATLELSTLALMLLCSLLALALRWLGRRKHQTGG